MNFTAKLTPYPQATSTNFLHKLPDSPLPLAQGKIASGSDIFSPKTR